MKFVHAFVLLVGLLAIGSDSSLIGIEREEVLEYEDVRNPTGSGAANSRRAAPDDYASGEYRNAHNDVDDVDDANANANINADADADADDEDSTRMFFGTHSQKFEQLVDIMDIEASLKEKAAACNLRDVCFHWLHTPVIREHRQTVEAMLRYIAANEHTFAGAAANGWLRNNCSQLYEKCDDFVRLVTSNEIDRLDTTMSMTTTITTTSTTTPPALIPAQSLSTAPVAAQSLTRPSIHAVRVIGQETWRANPRRISDEDFRRNPSAERRRSDYDKVAHGHDHDAYNNNNNNEYEFEYYEEDEQTSQQR